MSLIEYHPGKSFMHKLDPRVKIFMMSILTIVIFMVQNFYVIAALFITFLALWNNAKLPAKNLKNYFIFMIGLLGFIILLQTLFYPGSHYILKPLIPNFVPLIGGMGALKWEGFLFGLLLGLRLITLIVLMPLVTMTTPIHLLALGLVRLGMSYKIAFMTTTAINLIPTFESETQVIMDAQKMRGMKDFEEGGILKKMKAYPALVVPLVIGAMRRAQMMGVAMDARAFGAYQTRTYIEDIKMQKKDYLVIILIAIYAVAAVVINYMLQGR
ncbi:MAG: energy-coupling factor transporter transmembrane component T [Clostridia bacterium]